MKRKKNFLLIEVIVGLALFSLCALPLVRQPFILTQASYDRLFESELYNHAESTRCRLIAALYEGKLPWSSLPRTPSTKYLLLEEPCEIALGQELTRSFSQTALISYESAKKIQTQQEARLLKLTITYSRKGPKQGKAKDLAFSYLFTVIVPCAT